MQLYEIEILHSKKYDEQLNLTRSYIINKLFEITKEFKESELQQNLLVEFSKDGKVLKETIFVDPWLDLNKVKLGNIDINELSDKNTKNSQQELITGHMKGSG